MTMIEDARKLRISVTGATIEAYGVAAKKKLVAEAVQSWAELEDQLEIVDALTKDATDVLNERVNGTFADDANPSDNELELAGTENVESEGGRRLAPPPPFSEVSSLFGPLEKYAESCGISGAAYHLRKAKMDFIHARSSKPAVQADIRAMFSDS